jgi:hypothetical protein
MTSSADDAAEIRRLDDPWNAAYVHNDRAPLAQIGSRDDVMDLGRSVHFPRFSYAWIIAVFGIWMTPWKG